MLTGIDHVILAASDPEASAAELERVLGLAATAGGRHDAHGTYNRLVFAGDAYLELMGVFDTGIADASWWGPHIKARLVRAPAAYAGLPLSSDELSADYERLQALGSTILAPVAGERIRPDGEVVRWQAARLPAPDPDLGLAFLIGHDTAGAEWRATDREARAAQVHPLGTPARLVRVELPVPDVRSATLRLLRQLGLQFRPSLAGQGARDASIGAQTLRVSSRTERPRITLRGGKERRKAQLFGCDWELLPF